MTNKNVRWQMFSLTLPFQLLAEHLCTCLGPLVIPVPSILPALRHSLRHNYRSCLTGFCEAQFEPAPLPYRADHCHVTRTFPIKWLVVCLFAFQSAYGQNNCSGIWASSSSPSQVTNHFRHEHPLRATIDWQYSDAPQLHSSSRA